MTYYSVPMLLDVFRITSDSDQTTEQELIRYLKKSPGGFNYNRAALFQRKAYAGYKNLTALHEQCLGDGSTAEKVQNAKVLKLILEIGRGRTIQTFNFPRRKLSLAKGIEAPLGPSFFFTENGEVKLFYLHCRNAHRGTLLHLGKLAAAFSFEVLQNDFYGLRSDIEIVDVGPRSKYGEAKVELLTLDRLVRPTKDDLQTVYDRFVRVFSKVDDGRLAGEKRPLKQKDKPMDGQESFDFR